MPEVPSPSDVAFMTLQWLGVPALVLAPFVVALAVAEWVKTARAIGRGAVSVGRIADRIAALRPTRLALLTVGQALVVAAVYSGFRLSVAMSQPLPNGRNIADGSSFTWEQLWSHATTYTAAEPLPVQAALVAVGWVLGIDVAVAFRMRVVAATLGVVCRPAGVLSLLCAVVVGAVGLVVLSLATGSATAGYTVEMVSLYAVWFAILITFGLGALGARGLAERAFATER
ncbi:hypothetical protein GCM10027059_37860 [Myceligenerans halotolerans]